MDKIEEIKVQLIDLMDGSATIDETAEAILSLFIVSGNYNNCGHEWEITTGRCVKCGKSKYH